MSPGDATVTPVVDGLWRLRLPLPWRHIPHVNAYALARDDGGVTLIDAGSAGDPSNWEAFVRALRQAGFEPTDVREIVITHYHSDHAGLLARFVDENGCVVLGHEAHQHYTDAVLRPGEIARARERRARREGVPADRLPRYRTVREEYEGVLAPVLPDRHLHEGDVVESALGPWRVLETPGHAPSHIALWQRERGLLLSGDLITSVYAPYSDYGYSPDPVSELDGSLVRVGALDPAPVALPGHGRPIDDLRAVVAEWREGLRRDVETVERAIAEAPGTAFELMERIHGPADAAVDAPWLLTQTMCYLRHLRLTGRIEREQRGGIYRYRPPR